MGFWYREFYVGKKKTACLHSSAAKDLYVKPGDRDHCQGNHPHRRDVTQTTSLIKSAATRDLEDADGTYTGGKDLSGVWWVISRCTGKGGTCFDRYHKLTCTRYRETHCPQPRSLIF